MCARCRGECNRFVHAEVPHFIAGAPLAGLARSIRGNIPVPLVAGVSSAVRHVESLVRARPRASQQLPPAKPSVGLSPALHALLECTVRYRFRLPSAT